MGGSHTAHQPVGDAFDQRVGDRAAREKLGERRAIHILHHNDGVSFVLKTVGDRYDVGVPDTSLQLRFSKQPLLIRRVAEAVLHHLKRMLRTERDVPREVDRSHRARAQLAFDTVSVNDGFLRKMHGVLRLLLSHVLTARAVLVPYVVKSERLVPMRTRVEGKW